MHIALAIFLFCFSLPASEIEASVQIDSQAQIHIVGQSDMINQLGKGLSERETIASQVVAENFSRQISSIEWLAPLAPVALSPFFGITLLSGLACYGPDWLPDNALLSDGSPMANPMLFWVFLVLTLLTSAPRFSKVSKPVAQLADFLETYSAIVILVVLKFISIQSEQVEPVAMVMGEQAGILAAGWEGLLAVAMAVNIFVINAVRFFFEILVWITPIPFLDACFEAANKSLCAGLMAIYAFSPLIAFVVNVLLFICCALVFAWVRRREIFYRAVLLDRLIAWFAKSKTTIPEKLVVFPKSKIGDLPARSKCLLETTDGGWVLTHQRLLRGPIVELIAGEMRLQSGWWTNSIVLDDGRSLSFGVRFNDQLSDLADEMKLKVEDEKHVLDEETSRQLEFA